jgi:hypothetical protein
VAAPFLSPTVFLPNVSLFQVLHRPPGFRSEFAARKSLHTGIVTFRLGEREQDLCSEQIGEQKDLVFDVERGHETDTGNEMRRFRRCGKLKARYLNGLAGRGSVCAESGTDFGQVPCRFDDIKTSDNVYYVNIKPGNEELFTPPSWSTSLQKHNPISNANAHSCSPPPVSIRPPFGGRKRVPRTSTSPIRGG